MVRTTKSDKQTASAQTTTTPTTQTTTTSPAPATQAVATTETTTKKVKKVKSTVETAPVSTTETIPAETALSNEVVADAVAVDSTSAIVKINEFSAKLQQLTNLFSTVKNDFKTLEKTILRDLKNAQKSSLRKKKSSGNRQPSGFVKPTLITEELATFLGKKVGIEMARTEVSREINQYIRTNNLQDKANGRKINADSKLSVLLKLNQGDELTYFNLQRYMKHHFIKTDSTTAPATATATA